MTRTIINKKICAVRLDVQPKAGSQKKPEKSHGRSKLGSTTTPSLWRTVRSAFVLGLGLVGNYASGQKIIGSSNPFKQYDPYGVAFPNGQFPSPQNIQAPSPDFDYTPPKFSNNTYDLASQMESSLRGRLEKQDPEFVQALNDNHQQTGTQFFSNKFLQFLERAQSHDEFKDALRAMFFKFGMTSQVYKAVNQTCSHPPFTQSDRVDILTVVSGMRPLATIDITEPDGRGPGYYEGLNALAQTLNTLGTGKQFKVERGTLNGRFQILFYEAGYTNKMVAGESKYLTQRGGYWPKHTTLIKQLNAGLANRDTHDYFVSTLAIMLRISPNEQTTYLSNKNVPNNTQTPKKPKSPGLERECFHGCVFRGLMVHMVDEYTKWHNDLQQDQTNPNVHTDRSR